MKRTRSMELKTLREQLKESPPPAPAGASLREWFAGLALMNPVLMQGLEAQKRVQEAVRLADELMKALAQPRTPSMESMAAPTAEELVEQENLLSAQRERQTRETMPALRAARAHALPPPGPPVKRERPPLPSPTRYSHVDDVRIEDNVSCMKHFREE